MIKIFSSLIFFFTFQFFKRRIIKKIEIDGNKRISDETIKVYGEIELNKNYIENDLNEIIKKFTQQIFF